MIGITSEKQLEFVKSQEWAMSVTKNRLILFHFSQAKSIRLSMPKGLWKTPLFNKRQNGSMQQMLWARSTKMRKKYFLIFWVILNFTSHSLLFMGAKSWQELINSHMLEWHVFQCLIKISWNLGTSDVTKDLFVFKCGFCWVI